MSMIAGSHRDDIKTHLETFHEDNILTRGQAIQQVDESVAVDLILAPGQMSLHHCKVIHGSRPNRSQQRRVGFTLQGYVPAGGRQTRVPTTGCRFAATSWKPFIELKRPLADMDPAGVGERQKANQNWTGILYQGASQKRAY